MKRLNYAIRGMIMCLGIFMVLCMYGTESQAAKDMDIEVIVKNKTTVEIRWTRKSVTGYEIYRAGYDKSGNLTRYQKIATVSGKKTKYTDKTAQSKKEYSYKVKAYKKNGKRKSYKYEGSFDAYTGTRNPILLPDGYEDAKTTPNSIKFCGSTSGIIPTAFEIYRKEGSSKWKKIKTISTKGRNYGFEYEDKKVTKGKTYSYKMRTYKKINGKKTYSKYSNTIKLTAMNEHEVFTMQNYTKVNGKTKSIIVGLTSNEGNRDVLFEDSSELEYIHSFGDDDHKTLEDDPDPVELVPVKYSFDNVNWENFPDKGVKVAEYETIYLMFEARDGNEFDFYASGIPSSYIYWVLGTNGVWLEIDFIDSTAYTRSDW